jgi:3-hydroxyisobutyrate dehydrogenase-like beta-hydroxyacid dehydrogenase
MNDILNSSIGVAGCGTMGLPMLEVLLKNNINAFGYDVLSHKNFLGLEDNFISSKKRFFSKG